MDVPSSPLGYQPKVWSSRTFQCDWVTAVTAKRASPGRSLLTTGHSVTPLAAFIRLSRIGHGNGTRTEQDLCAKAFRSQCHCTRISRNVSPFPLLITYTISLSAAHPDSNPTRQHSRLRTPHLNLDIPTCLPPSTWPGRLAATGPLANDIHLPHPDLLYVLIILLTAHAHYTMF